MFNAKYKRLRLLGEGAFGAAYLVQRKDRSGVQEVAKEIRITHLTEKQREAALSESEVLRKMSHSNIIAYIDSFLEERMLYIVMEYADGGDLAYQIRDRKEEERLFEERKVMFIFVQVTLALDHIHSRKILHRDLKPLNVFLTQKGVVKLGDFGIAKVLESTEAGAQTTIGTPAYLSPEICNNEAYGVKSDLWSLGVVTYELAVLRVPFGGMSVPAIALKIMGVDPDPLPEVFSPDLQWIVTQLLQKEPERRPRLDKILKMPFVQKYLQELLSHTREHRSGGCEGMAKRSLPAATAEEESMTIEAPAGPELVKHKAGHPSRGERHASRAEYAHEPGASEARRGAEEEARQETERERRHREGMEKYRRQREEMAEAARQHRRAAEHQFHEGRALAAEVKRRQEHVSASVLAGEEKRREYVKVRSERREEDSRGHRMEKGRDEMERRREGSPAGYRMDAAQQLRGQRADVAQNLDMGEARKAEVRRKAQEERDQQEARRKKELERAMQEQEEDRRRLEENMLRRRCEEESSQTLLLDATTTADGVGDTLKAEQTSDPDRNHAENWHMDCQEGGSSPSQAQADKTRDVSTVDDDLISAGLGGFSIAFTDKVRPMPKLSTRSRRTRSETARSEMRELRSEPPTERSARERDRGLAMTSSRPRVSSGPPDVTPRAMRKQGSSTALVARQNSNPPEQRSSHSASRRIQSHNDARQAEERRQGCSSPSRGAVAESKGMPRPPRPARMTAVSGAPARWLRTNSSPIDESMEGCQAENEMNATLLLPADDAMNATVEWSISGDSPMSKTTRTPHGGGDVSQLQDALQNALCFTQGPPEIPEELGHTLRSTSFQSPPPETKVTGVSIRSDLNFSESEDER